GREPWPVVLLLYRLRLDSLVANERLVREVDRLEEDSRAARDVDVRGEVELLRALREKVRRGVGTVGIEEVRLQVQREPRLERAVLVEERDVPHTRHHRHEVRVAILSRHRGLGARDRVVRVQTESGEVARKERELLLPVDLHAADGGAASLLRLR